MSEVEFDAGRVDERGLAVGIDPEFESAGLYPGIARENMAERGVGVVKAGAVAFGKKASGAVALVRREDIGLGRRRVEGDAPDVDLARKHQQ